MRIHHLHVQHRVDAHLHVVAGDADLFGDVDRDFLEAVPVGDPLHERHENMKPGRQRAAVLAQVLDHVGALLRHHRRGLGNHNDDQYGDEDECVAEGHGHEFSPCTTSVKPSTRSIRARCPAAMGLFPPLTAFHELPQYSSRQVSPGLQFGGQHHGFAGRPLLHGGQFAAHALVDPPPKCQPWKTRPRPRTAATASKRPAAIPIDPEIQRPERMRRRTPDRTGHRRKPTQNPKVWRRPQSTPTTP